jgi:hypothetical protein
MQQVLALLLAAASAAPVAEVGAAGATASAEVQQVAQWVLDSKDNQHRPYVIVDKANARVFVFDSAGRLRGADAALLGMARGDTPRAGTRNSKLAQLGPKDRITPAGRFLANLDRDALGQPLLLVDYELAIALHPVVKGTVAEHRAARLASATSADNRISFGCINVPLPLFRDVVSTVFAHTDGYVYILPESGAALPLFARPGPR